MNENFFGKYSVFCVFGSVVGCVVVPLIAQVLQQQSMECMILSAIFFTLAAAHFKKGSIGSDNHHSKLLLSRDYDRKKCGSNNNTSKKQKSTNTHHNNNHHQQQRQQQHDQNELEYMQQHEHLRILEMEKRNEEKRLKKQKKREERLRKKEEETKKQKEIEEKYKALKEKRRKQHQKENDFRSNLYHNIAANNYDKYCAVDSSRNSSYPHRKCRSHSQDDDNRTPHQSFNKHGYTTRQNIPRFNTRKNNTVLMPSHENGNLVRSNSEVLSINCASLSASCSSLSSISSSGSSSPPPPTSPKSVNGSAAWKTSYQFSDSDSTKSLSPHKYDSTSIRQEFKKSWSLQGNIEEETQRHNQQQQHQQRVLKSYTNVRPVRNKVPTYNFNSSSLFCSSQEDDSRKQVAAVEEVTTGGEYSLFGSQQFGKSFIKSPII